MVHLDFVCELYKEQVDNGRYFLHEHPERAGSWDETCIIDMEKEPGVDKVVCDQCQYGQSDMQGNPVRKRTALLSNSAAI